MPCRMKSIAAAAAVAGCLSLLPVETARAQAAPRVVSMMRPADTIDVSVQGRFEAQPDTAVLGIDIRGQNRDLKKAYAQAQQQAEQVRALLRQQGIPADEAQLGSYQVQPNIDWRSHKLIDYTVVTHVEVDLKDFSKIGPLVDAAGQAGLPAFDRVSFELKDMQKARQQAIADGYRKALAEAQEVAQLAQRRIKKLQYASVDVAEPGPIFPRPVMMARAAAGAAPAPTEQFAPQKLTVTAQVRATFEMAPEMGP